MSRTSAAHQQLQTGLVSRHASVETVEHLLAALRSLGVDNVCVELNHPKCPSWTAARRRGST